MTHSGHAPEVLDSLRSRFSAPPSRTTVTHHRKDTTLISIRFAMAPASLHMLGSTALGLALTRRLAAAQYPTKPVRLLLGSAPGGAADLLMRLLASEMTTQLGQQVIIDNRPGGSGIIASEMIAGASPDGDTIGYGNAASLAINPALFDKLSYDTLKDFQPIARYNFSQNVLVVRSALPVQSVRELIDYARRNPGKLSYGSPGSGTSVHLAGELFQQMTGTKMLHVP